MTASHVMSPAGRAPATEPLDPPMLLTPEEAARELRVSRSRMFEMIGAGAVDSILIGPRQRRVIRASLVEYIQAQLAVRGARNGSA
jgi:excisionase family DNA binding protein